jgi:hypothetical protein
MTGVSTLVHSPEPFPERLGARASDELTRVARSTHHKVTESLTKRAMVPILRTSRLVLDAIDVENTLCLRNGRAPGVLRRGGPPQTQAVDPAPQSPGIAGAAAPVERTRSTS